MRGFEKITSQQNNDHVHLPKRQTAHAAGYDIHTPEEVTIGPHAIAKIHTGIKAHMQEDEVLQLYIRSSMGIKRHLVLANQVGVIDSDYYNNPSNEGEIIIALRNTSNEAVLLPAGERIAQGVFMKFLKANDDEASASRSGGIGSTNT